MTSTLKLMAALAVSFTVSAVFGKFYIPWLHRQKAGQSIKENGPT